MFNGLGIRNDRRKVRSGPKRFMGMFEGKDCDSFLAMGEGRLDHLSREPWRAHGDEIRLAFHTGAATWGGMKTSLDHLPDGKQRELASVVRILFEEFEAVTARASQQWKKGGRILKVMLYGSYARGDWVDDPVGGYRSDYDILVVVSDDRLTDVIDFWSVADDRLMRETSIAGTLSAPVNFIVHSLSDVNSQLERGRPFFIDIVEHGAMLYEAEGFAFTMPRKLPEEQAKVEAEAYFNEWFPAPSVVLTWRAQRPTRDIGRRPRSIFTDGGAALSLRPARADPLQP
jgi:predicted nucleotidyltransferase